MCLLKCKTNLLPATSKVGKQTTLQFKPIAKKPKKNLWSGDESEGVTGSDMEEEEAAAPRERIERRTKGESASLCFPASLTESLAHLDPNRPKNVVSVHSYLQLPAADPVPNLNAHF